MAFGKIIRLGVAAVIAIPLAVAAGAQAASMVLLKVNPALSAELFPANGMALASLAFADYASNIVDPAAPPPPSEKAVKLAEEALRKEPFAAKAYVVLAQAESDPDRKRAIIELGSSLNRRDLALQGLVLQERLADRDYPGAIETLDQILRVHPNRSQDFFPLLAGALAQDSTLPIFAKMLDGSAPWHERFLDFAVGQPIVLTNLARLRLQLAIGEEDFDRRLIASLVQRGDIETAGKIYSFVASQEDVTARSGKLDWRSTYPPFDWALVEKTAFRAQVSRDGEELELYVKPGQGGVIASRMLTPPAGPFEIVITHSLEPAGQIEDVKVQLSCAGNPQPIVTQPFKSGTTRIDVSSVPGACRYLALGIDARAWSGQAPIVGTISEISLRANSKAAR